MADFKEEAYVLEKYEISDDGDDGYEYKEIKYSDDEDIVDVSLDPSVADLDDLNDFNALKTKTEAKKMATQLTDRGASFSVDAVPHTLSRDVVIDDFIRNFFMKFKMDKTLNIFHQEWHELQKKGTFHDV